MPEKPTKAETEYRVGRGPHFATVPFELQDQAEIDPRIDGAAIAVYAALRRFAHFGKSTGARCSDAAGAKKAGVSPRTFRDRRQRLRDTGWVEWEGENGAVNQYIVHASLSETAASDTAAGHAGVCPPRQDTPGGSAGDAAVSPKPRREVPTNEKRTKNKKEQTSTIDGQFEATWKAYPRRAGGNPKRPALQKWLARRAAGASADQLHAAVLRYAAYVRHPHVDREGTEFVMQASTFFGPGERWKEPWAPPARGSPNGRRRTTDVQEYGEPTEELKWQN